MSEETRASPNHKIGITSPEFEPVMASEEITLHGDETRQGSKHQHFRERWRRIMEQVIATLRLGGPVPYCSVDFLHRSYNCLFGFSDNHLVSEFIDAGRILATSRVLKFPHPQLPVLSRMLSQIRVWDSNGEGLLWWPSHMQSGDVCSLEDTILKAVVTKARLAREYDWQGATEKWLVLFAEGRGLTDVIIGGLEPVPLHAFPADFPFTLVLVWDKFSENVWKVFPQFRAICDGTHQTRKIIFTGDTAKVCHRWQTLPHKTKGILIWK